MFTIDIDVGGTFTDGYFSSGAEARTAKVLTTPHDITECIMNCVRAGAAVFGVAVADFLHRCVVARVSTTVGTNLLIEAAGPRIGLLVTRGAEDTLYAARAAAAPVAFVPPGMVAGIDEAVDDAGVVHRPVDKEAVLAAVRDLLGQGARMIVVSFRNAWLNAANERRVVEIVLARYPVHYLRSIPIQLATDIVHVDDDHARTNSAILNAYIHADMARSLYRAEDELREAGLGRPLLVVHANGGNARIAKTVALHTLNSGPAACATGAAWLARRLGLTRVVTGDMGGTSFDVALIRDGAVELEAQPTVFGLRIGVPALRVASVGGGGGSIARVAGGDLQVGPESAGGAPGPACYDKGGTEPTVTDADLVLGFLDAGFFLGGRMRLRPDLAERVLRRRVADGLGITAAEAALRVRACLARNLAAVITALLREQGFEAAQFTLFTMGGAGPLHACEIAAQAGIERVIAFSFGSVFSAFGSCMTDLQHAYTRSLGDCRLVDAARIEATVAELRHQALADMEGEGCAAAAVALTVEIHLGGDAAPRTLVWQPQAQTLAECLEEHRDVVPDDTRVTQIHLKATSATPRPELPTGRAAGSDASAALKGHREVVWDRDGARRTVVYDREALRAGHAIDGPALVEGADTVYAVPAGWRLVVDALSCFVITRAGG